MKYNWLFQLITMILLLTAAFTFGLFIIAIYYLYILSI